MLSGLISKPCLCGYIFSYLLLDRRWVTAEGFGKCFESPKHLKQSCESFWLKSTWKVQCVSHWVPCTHFLSQASSDSKAREGSTWTPWGTVKRIKSETGNCCYKILHVSLTDNYLKSLTGSLIIITTTITKTTPKLQNCLSYLALVILLKTAAALCRMSKSRMERCVAEAPLFPSVPEPFLLPISWILHRTVDLSTVTLWGVSTSTECHTCGVEIWQACPNNPFFFGSISTHRSCMMKAMPQFSHSSLLLQHSDIIKHRT